MTSLTDGGSRISTPVAQQLIGTYKNEEGWPPDKTRAVWFSLDSLVDMQTLINEHGGDGIRIYFGKYPQDVDIPGTPDPAYKGKVTLVFIPTVTTADGSHQDIFPPVAPDATTASGQPAQNTTLAGTDGSGYDHGSLCPPNCPPSSPTPGQ
ncbi:hypothetical protein Q4E93_26730 [Flavitalea sp. BT771]|uniref:hypothetical protein n=1 Tax=Flavitalea sp. BT771 TaxID=3063329 RepID=UPI0026E13B58|nr:hypothetical protein [Flavitalea sp. BT771]MDO6434234.1 hypothetical protein [Flavitalea sp. BT771]MDV6223134.1 hypothetical protein [Flavitalea sp. BT771]